MHEFADWSVGLGRWWGVPVRIHLLFVLFAVLAVLAGAQAAPDVGFAGMLAVLVLLVSVSVHELAHLAVARRLGGRVYEVVIGPFGGLVRPAVPDVPRAYLLVALAGPLANLLFALLAAAALAFRGESVVGLLNVVTPANITEGPTVVVALRLGVWLNWLLALVNLLPVFPFDGAIAYRDLLRPWVGGRTAAAYVARAGFLCGVGLLAAAWWLRASQPLTAVGVWLAFVAAAVFVLFSAHRDSRRFNQLPDFSMKGLNDDDGLRDDPIDFEEELLEEPVSADAWCATSTSQNEPWRSGEDDAEDAQLDHVLAKLHHSGFDALSAEDRQLLERASLRYRSRRRKQSTEDA